MYSYCSSVHPFLLRSVESSCGHLGTRRGTQSAGLRSIHQLILGQQPMKRWIRWWNDWDLSWCHSYQWYISDECFPAASNYAQKVPGKREPGLSLEGRSIRQFLIEPGPLTGNISDLGGHVTEDGCVVDMSATSLVQPWSFLNKLYPLRLSTNPSAVSSDPSDWRHGSIPS